MVFSSVWQRDQLETVPREDKGKRIFPYFICLCRQFWFYSFTRFCLHSSLTDVSKNVFVVVTGLENAAIAPGFAEMLEMKKKVEILFAKKKCPTAEVEAKCNNVQREFREKIMTYMRQVTWTSTEEMQNGGRWKLKHESNISAKPEQTFWNEVWVKLSAFKGSDFDTCMTFVYIGVIHIRSGMSGGQRSGVTEAS